MPYYKTSSDLVVGVSHGNGSGLRSALMLPLDQLRYNGEEIIDARAESSWLIDDLGQKRLPEMHEQSGWQQLECALSDVLIRDNGVWKIRTEADELAEAKLHAADHVTAVATATRARLAGTADPAKLAEYADKALNAQAVIDGTAPADIMAEAASEAASLGLADEAAVAQIWLQKAAALRGLRAEINVIEREALAAVDSAQAPAALASAVASTETALATIGS